MLNSADLSWMAADVQRTLPDTGVYQSPTFANDGSGGYTSTYTNAGTVACRVDPLSHKDKLELLALAERMLVDCVVSMPQGTPIDVHYRFIHNSLTYEITGLFTGNSWAAVTRAYLARVK